MCWWRSGTEAAISSGIDNRLRELANPEEARRFLPGEQMTEAVR